MNTNSDQRVNRLGAIVQLVESEQRICTLFCHPEPACAIHYSEASRIKKASEDRFISGSPHYPKTGDPEPSSGWQ